MTASRVLKMNLERSSLPASLEAERSILGTILLDRRAYSEAAQTLSPADFSLDAHRRIYSRMVEIAGALEPIDLVLLVEELERHKELSAVGDAAYVSSLVDGVPDRPSIEHYVRIVREKTQLRSLIYAAEAAIARAMDGEKPTEISSDLLETVLDIESRAQVNHALSPRDFMPEVVEELKVEAQSGGVVGLPTGIDGLDLMTGGLRKGELVVVGALPGAGKTAFAVQILTANVEAGNKVGVFSIEMSRWDLGRRFLSAVTSVSAAKIRQPRHIAKEEWLTLAQGSAKICEWPVVLDDSGAISISELLARARLFITRMEAKLIIVDYLQIAKADGRDIREQVGKTADALRQLAKAERISVVLLSQLRRPQNVNDAPTMIDLKETSDIEAHAHIVLLLHMPTRSDGNPTGEDTVIVAKNRNGAKGPIPVVFNRNKLRFDPRTTTEQHQPTQEG